MGLLELFGNDAVICGTIIEVGLLLVESIGRLEGARDVPRPITNDNLRGVFVRHDESGFRQLRALSTRIVLHERLPHHAEVMSGSILECFLRPGGDLFGTLLVLE